MSLTPETVDRLQAGAAATKHTDLQDMQTQIPAVIVMDGPGKTRVESIEHLQELRSRFRGTMSTNSIRDFVKYVVDRKVSPRGFINVERIDALSCKVFFDLGTVEKPGHGDDTAVLSPKMMAAFSALRGIVGKKLTQQELIDWIEDWHHVLTAEKGPEEYISVAAAVAAIRNMKLNVTGERGSKVESFGESRSSFEQVEANRDGNLPAFISMRTEPFDGFKARTFKLRVAVLTGTGVPMLTLRWQGQEHQCEEIAQEFKEMLNGELGGLSDSLVVGSFALGK